MESTYKIKWSNAKDFLDNDEEEAYLQIMENSDECISLEGDRRFMNV